MPVSLIPAADPAVRAAITVLSQWNTGNDLQRQPTRALEEIDMPNWLWIVIVVVVALAAFGYFRRGRTS